MISELVSGMNRQLLGNLTRKMVATSGGLFSSTTKNVELEVTLESLVYRQGDKLIATVKCCNEYLRKLKPYIVIVQKEKYFGGGLMDKAWKRKVESLHYIASGSDFERKAIATSDNETTIWDKVEVEVPDIIANSINSDRIKITHLVEVGLSIAMGSNIKVQFPIIIGCSELDGRVIPELPQEKGGPSRYTKLDTK